MTDIKLLIIGVLSAIMLSSCSVATNHRNSAATNETEKPRATENADNNSMRDAAGNMIDDAGDVVQDAGDTVEDAAEKVGDKVG